MYFLTADEPTHGRTTQTPGMSNVRKSRRLGEKPLLVHSLVNEQSKYIQQSNFKHDK